MNKIPILGWVLIVMAIAMILFLWWLSKKSWEQNETED